MLCRLCLYEFTDLVSIFSDEGESIEKEIIKYIIKYLEIQLDQNDELSTKICHKCLQHLQDFNSFCQFIALKQQSLQAEMHAKQLNILNNDFTNLKDFKDPSLCEPQIDIATALNKDYDGISTKEFENDFPVEATTDGDNDDDVGSKCFDNKNFAKQQNTQKTLKKQNTSENESQKRILRKRKVFTKTLKCTTETLKKRKLREIGIEMDAYIAEHIELICCLCKKTLCNFAQLKIHFRKEHQCVGYMPCCNNRYKKRSRLVEHLKVHSDPNYFKCAVCEKVLISRNSYNNHMDTMHPSEDQLKFQCSACLEKFTKQYILDIHMNKQHGEEKELKCEVCQKIYRSTGSLRDHMTNVHLNLSQTICDLCGQVLRSKQGLAYHMRSKHQVGQQKEMQCNLCGKWLKNERSHYKHMYNHQDEASNRKFACAVCGTEKTTRTKLACHIRYHHSEKNYKCTLCEKEFKSKVSLNEHMATHTGRDLYSCPFCPRTFKSHANMHNHKKKMHPDKWIPRNTQPTQDKNEIKAIAIVDIGTPSMT